MIKQVENSKMPAFHSCLAKMSVQCFVKTFVVNQTLVSSYHICGKIRHLHQAATC
ncbi:hypothetical protein [Flavobacterium sp. DSP2-3-1]|uniref:hypothetical protein n=1 Tax=Flavobacterium sp. DSP2-3-1 TaxID=2804620 RepID=UPI003CED8181